LVFEQPSLTNKKRLKTIPDPPVFSDKKYHFSGKFILSTFWKLGLSLKWDYFLLVIIQSFGRYTTVKTEIQRAF